MDKMKGFKSELLFIEIDYSFLKAYDRYLTTVRNNNENTTIKSLSFIKAMINEAIKLNIIKDNPFKDYKLGRIEGNREFLRKDELAKLQKLYNIGQLKTNKANVLRYFLFCCYTGLRYQDIKNLKFGDIQNNSAISLIMGKTKKPVYIPLIDKAKNLLPDTGFNNQKVFRVLTDQPTNRYLKDIMKAVQINKNISFHCSRHTFATVAKSMGISYDVINAMLGHTDLKTTKIYTKYENEYLEKEMAKLN